MLSTALALLAAFALVLANAFFVASEFAMVKVRPTRLQTMAPGGGFRVRAALEVTQKLDAYLSANQLGITLASIALGWIGEPAFAGLLEPVIGRVAGDAAHSVGVAASFLMITFLHVVLGELAPKSIAIQHTERVALWTAPPLRVFYMVAFPVIWTFNAASRLVLRVLGLHRNAHGEKGHSAEEARLILREVNMTHGVSAVMDRLFDYTNRIARHVMTRRTEVVVLAAEVGFEDGVREALASQFTRYPVVDDADHVTGYVHFKDVANALVASPRPKDLRSLLREPIRAKEDTRVEDLRRAFIERKVHLAVIEGPGGGFVGIVTLEDLLEEFVGEIQDEQDQGEVPPIGRLADGAFDVAGTVTLDVVAREVGLDLRPPGSRVEMLGAAVRERLGGRARKGDHLDVADRRVTVTETREGRVRRVRIEEIAAPPEQDL